jgi:hypothetical protein
MAHQTIQETGQPPLADMAYLGRCRRCGGVVLMVEDTPTDPATVARHVAQAIRAGAIVDRLPADVARAHLRAWCECRAQ